MSLFGTIRRTGGEQREEGALEFFPGGYGEWEKRRRVGEDGGWERVIRSRGIRRSRKVRRVKWEAERRGGAGGRFGSCRTHFRQLIRLLNCKERRRRESGRGLGSRRCIFGCGWS